MNIVDLNAVENIFNSVTDVSSCLVKISTLYSVKRFDRSNGLDTVLYKNVPFTFSGYLSFFCHHIDGFCVNFV